MGRVSGLLGLFALAIVLAVLGLAYTAVKWLLIVAVVIVLLGVLRAFVSSRGRESPPGGPDGH
jgi:membrane protein implicated in regulation of membrane protease activity